MRLTLTLRLLALTVAIICSGAITPSTTLADLIDQNAETEYGETVVAYTPQHDPMSDRLTTIESRLAMIESSPSAGTSCRSKVTPSMHVSTNSIGCPSNYAGFEFAILKPHVGALGGSIPLLGAAGQLTSTFDFDVAPRVFVGRERADGLGIRGTYFQYDHKTDPSAIGVITGLQLHTFDLEATSRTKFCGSDVQLSAGFRYGHLTQDLTLPGLGSLEFDSEGGGLTIGGQLKRDLGRTAWDLVIGGRGSILMTDNEASIPGLISAVAEESTM